MLELKEEVVHYNPTSLHLETPSSSVKENVKEKTFSLKQMVSQLRAADTASDLKTDPLEEEKCLWPSHS